MKQRIWYLILTSFLLVAVAIAAQTDWSDGDSGLVVQTALQANDTELYLIKAGLADNNTFTGNNTLGKLTNIIFTDGTETVTSDAFAFTSNWTLANFNWNIAFPAASIINATTGLLSTSAQVVNTITSFAAPTTANPYALTAANSYNSVVYYGATGEIDIPALADGMAVIIYNTGAFTITIDPNASEAIVVDGTLQTGGVSFTLSSGAGNFVCIVSDGTNWITKGFKGTLAEGT